MRFCTSNPNTSRSRTLAIGLESGEILIYTSTRENASQWTNVLTIEKQYAHVFCTNSQEVTLPPLAWLISTTSTAWRGDQNLAQKTVHTN